MKKLLIVLALGLALLTGCASNPDYEQWARAVEAQHSYAAQAASGCETDLCRYMVTEKITTGAIRAPRQDYHPAWQLLDRTLSIALPIYGSYLQGQQWS